MNEYDKKYMSKRIEFNSANETEAMIEKQRLGILAENSDRISAIPRNEAINSVADFVKEVRAVANRVTIPDFVPLFGDMGVGDLLVGEAPEEIENIAYGNMPFEITPMGDRIPRLKRNRKQSFFDAAVLGVDAAAVARPLAKGASAGLKKAGQVVDQNKEVLRPVGSIRMGGGDGTKPAVERTTDDFGFYSKALEETQKLKQEKGTGQQFKQMLVKSGVKQEEMDWLGLEDVFKEKKLTKEDIVKHINDNRIKLREVVATGESNVSMDFGEGVELTPAQTYGDNYIEERAGELMDEVDTSQNEVYGTTLDYDEAVKMAEEEYYNDPVMKYVDSKTGYTIIGNDSLGYSIYQSEAETVGEGAYQNAFATSSGKKLRDMRRDESRDLEDIYSLDEAEVQARGLAETNGDLTMEGDTRWSDYVEPDGENYQELRFQLDDDEVKFTEGVHFSDDENNLFHIRTTDRDYNGDKVLYVEELQSDWGQKGRDVGFKKTEEEMKAISQKRKEAELLANKYSEQIKKISEEEPDEVAKLDANDPDSRLKKLGKERLKLLEYLKDTQNFVVENDRKLFDAPFVTSTDKWTQLAIKRLLSKAVDEGYDYVSFSPGDVQYDRWNKEGLITYYDYIVPKNAEKVLKQIDKNAITYTRRNDLGLDENKTSIGKGKLEQLQTKNKIPNTFFDNLYKYKNDSKYVLLKKGLFTIKITPQVKDKVTKGQSMFEGATPAVAVGAAAVGMNEDNDGRE